MCKSNLSFAITCHTASHTQHILNTYTHTCHMCQSTGLRREINYSHNTTTNQDPVRLGLSYTFFFSLFTNILYVHSLSIIPWQIQQQHTLTVRPCTHSSSLSCHHLFTTHQPTLAFHTFFSTAHLLSHASVLMVPEVTDDDK